MKMDYLSHLIDWQDQDRRFNLLNTKAFTQRNNTLVDRLEASTPAFREGQGIEQRDLTVL